jgi:dienelactone hydrolase
VARSLPCSDASRIAVIGFGFGGMCALDIARSGVALNGVVSIYGHFDAPKDYTIQPIKAKVLILQGYHDPIVPMHELIAFQNKMDQEKVDWQAHVYGKACHAFATPLARDEASGILYDAASAKRALKAAENFLEEVLG